MKSRSSLMSTNAQIIGMRRALLSDVYYFLMERSWLFSVGVVATVFVALNSFFASLYVFGGDCIENARPGSFADAFYFSVQTMATIGFGFMHPKNDYANILVAIESLTGLIGFALVTGVAFSKFSRVRPRVNFSDVAVVASHDGVPTLMFRVANERRNFIVDASMNLTLVHPDITKEGRSFIRLLDLELIRNRSSTFNLTWTVMHRIDDKSPLKNLRGQALASGNNSIVASLVGYDATTGQSIHTQHLYRPDSIMWGQRFVDILTPGTQSARSVLDFGKFHLTEPSEDLT